MQQLQLLENKINTITSRAGKPFRQESIESIGIDLSDKKENIDPQLSSKVKTESLSSIMTEFMDRELRFHTHHTISAIKLLSFKIDNVRNRKKNEQINSHDTKYGQKYAKRDLSPKGKKEKYSPLDRESVHSTVDMIALVDDAGDMIIHLLFIDHMTFYQ